MWLNEVANETHLRMQSAHEIISISDRIMRVCGHATLLQAHLLMRRAYQTPPECIGVGLKHLVILLLSEIHQERGQDQTQEANVPGGDQFLLNTPSINVNIKCLLWCLLQVYKSPTHEWWWWCTKVAIQCSCIILIMLNFWFCKCHFWLFYYWLKYI